MPGDWSEALQRLIHIERKVDRILEHGASPAGAMPAKPHPDQAFGNMSYAQHGEDLIFLNIFSLLGVHTPKYIDVGAYHPLNISNTALLYQRGCRGINIEANPNLITAFLEQRPEDVNLNVGIAPCPGELDFYCIDEWSGRNTFDKRTAEDFVRLHPEFRIREVKQIAAITLDEVIERYNGGRFPDLLTVDVEGFDYAVLAGATFDRSKPTVICAEAVSGADRDEAERLINLLSERGYRPYFRTLGNIIFVAEDALREIWSSLPRR